MTNKPNWNPPFKSGSLLSSSRRCFPSYSLITLRLPHPSALINQCLCPHLFISLPRSPFTLPFLFCHIAFILKYCRHFPKLYLYTVVWCCCFFIRGFHCHKEKEGGRPVWLLAGYPSYWSTWCVCMCLSDILSDIIDIANTFTDTVIHCGWQCKCINVCL